MPCVNGAWRSMLQETFQDRSLERCRMGWQFSRATLVAFKIKTYDNFEDCFYHVNQIVTIRAQDKTHVEKTDDWPTSAFTGHHLTCCILARGKIQGRMGAWSDPGGQYPRFPSEMRMSQATTACQSAQSVRRGL